MKCACCGGEMIKYDIIRKAIKLKFKVCGLTETQTIDSQISPSYFLIQHGACNTKANRYRHLNPTLQDVLLNIWMKVIR